MIDHNAAGGRMAGKACLVTGAAPEGQAMIEGLHPMKRLGTPREVANAALFLSSDEASFVTGETFSVDGGWVAW